MTTLTDRQRALLTRVLADANIPDLAVRVEQERLSREEIETVVDALSQAFHMEGIDEKFEATPYGVELEQLLDIVNAPRLGAAPIQGADSELSLPVTDERRDGWMAQCPNGHRFKATVLKSWGARWIALYDVRARFVYVDDYDAARGGAAAAYVARPDVAAWVGRAVDLPRAELSTTARCPACGVALPFEDGTLPSDVLWIEGQLLIDGKLRRLSRLQQVNVV